MRSRQHRPRRRALTPVPVRRRVRVPTRKRRWQRFAKNGERQTWATAECRMGSPFAQVAGRRRATTPTSKSRKTRSERANQNQAVRRIRQTMQTRSEPVSKRAHSEEGVSKKEPGGKKGNQQQQGQTPKWEFRGFDDSSKIICVSGGFSSQTKASLRRFDSDPRALRILSVKAFRAPWGRPGGRGRP